MTYKRDLWILTCSIIFNYRPITWFLQLLTLWHLHSQQALVTCFMEACVRKPDKECFPWRWKRNSELRKSTDEPWAFWHWAIPKAGVFLTQPRQVLGAVWTGALFPSFLTSSSTYWRHPECEQAPFPHKELHKFLTVVCGLLNRFRTCQFLALLLPCTTVVGVEDLILHNCSNSFSHFVKWIKTWTLKVYFK